MNAYDSKVTRRFRLCAISLPVAWVLLLVNFAPTVHSQDTSEQSDLSIVRSRLSELERESLDVRGKPSPWEEDLRLKIGLRHQELGTVSFVHEASFFSCSWLLTPESPEQGSAVRFCATAPGEEQVQVKPGYWKLQLMIGETGRGTLLLPERRVRIKASAGYRSVFDKSIETNSRNEIEKRNRRFMEALEELRNQDLEN